MNKKQHVQVGDHELLVTNADKVYFPGNGYSKGQVLAFYSRIADTILPHLSGRPLTLKRYPDGIASEPFYEKNAPSHTPDWVKRFAVPRSEGGELIHYILCNDIATLLWVCNLGDIEKHVLLAQAPNLHCPTSVVFDLDPGDPADILDCAEIALKLKDLFEGLGLESFVKVSGSKGLHLSVPLNTPTSYQATQPFAKAIAELMERQMPDRVVSAMAKNLRKGKILIDWSQNSDFKTTVAVYAMRAKHPEPYVSTPVTWEELKRALKRRNVTSLFFTPEQSIRRIKKLGDLYAPTLTLKQKLPAAFSDALAASPPQKLSRWPRNSKASPLRKPDHSLTEYAAKRDHARTPEPAAKKRSTPAKKNNVHRFVIQKHDASHLHYDWRLEMEGVLRSWAVPKGPPSIPRQTRLAMHVEDHPLEYASFEGTIPPNNYGAGTVMVWDHGEYEDLTGNPTAAFYQGKMHLIMRGEKLKGEWILVKDRRDDEGRRWLLIKAGNPMKLSAKADDTSVISGRSMRKIAADNDAQWQSNRPQTAPVKSIRVSKVRKASRPITQLPAKFVEPMQCLPVKEMPSDGGWTFEMKFDGYRCMAVKNTTQTTLYSRSKKKLNHRFPSLVEALQALPGSFAIDGELVALDQNGKPSFQLLQSHAKGQAVYFYAFDLVFVDGKDLQKLPLKQRRERLVNFLEAAEEPLRLSSLLDAPPKQVLEAVATLGLEGVVGKRLDSTYEAGERSGAWVKQRTNLQQEFVIGGYVPGRHDFDALLIGVYDKGRLQYVAKLKNGFVPRIRSEIHAQLAKRLSPTCPFANLPETKKSRWGEPLTAAKMEECRWIKPQLVCNATFVEWTGGGKLRHCSFAGMRDDKKPRSVIRET